MKRKTCDIRNWKKHLFLDIFSTNTDTLVPSLYQCVETRSTEIFWLLSQPIPHLRFNLFVISETIATFLDSVLNRFTRQTLPPVNRKYFFMNILCIESFLSTEIAQQNASFRYCTPQARSSFWLLKPASEHAHARLLPRLSCNWAVLLPSDTHKNLFRPLQLFYFHLWPIYLLSLVTVFQIYTGSVPEMCQLYFQS
jgi:hypothetical protein